MGEPRGKRRPKPVIERCDQHDVGGLSYLAFFDDSERRSKRGERQGLCDECGLWRWPEPAQGGLP